jgi:polar amino acid transport system substrate-binding protein
VNKFILICCLFWLPTSYAKLVVVTETVPNWHYINEQGELVGTVLDKVKTALDKSGLDYTLSVNSWSLSYNVALRDKNTCIFSIARLSVREDKFIWIKQLASMSASFYSFKPLETPLNTLAQAKQYRIAVLKDNYSHHFLVKHGFSEQKQLLLLNSFDRIFDILKNRQSSIDLVVLSEQHLIEKQKHKDSVLINLVPQMQLEPVPLTHYFACNKDMDKATITQLQHAFK